MKRVLASMSILLLSSAAWADPTTQPADSSSSSPWSISAQVTDTSAYFFRGDNQGDDNHLIIQPELTIGYSFYSSDKQLTITPYLDLWGNLTDKHFGNEDNWFNELDITPGVEFKTGRVDFSVEAITYYSPVDAFKLYEEGGFKLGFDDTGLTPLPFALNPHLDAYQQITRTADNAPMGSYMELGLAPLFNIAKLPMTVTIPVTLGTSLQHYYHDAAGADQFVGFGSAGVLVTWNVTDHWSIAGGADYYRLFAQNLIDDNNGDHSTVVGHMTLGYSY